MIQLLLKQYKSNFVIYDLLPRIYTIKDITEVFYTKGDHEGTLHTEYDDISKRTKLFSTRFGSISGIYHSPRTK